MDTQEGCSLFNGLYAVLEGYMDVREGCILFRGVICCSWGLYAVQIGYMVEKNDGLVVH